MFQCFNVCNQLQSTPPTLHRHWFGTMSHDIVYLDIEEAAFEEVETGERQETVKYEPEERARGLPRTRQRSYETICITDSDEDAAGTTTTTIPWTISSIKLILSMFYFRTHTGPSRPAPRSVKRKRAAERLRSTSQAAAGPSTGKNDPRFQDFDPILNTHNIHLIPVCFCRARNHRGD